MQKDYREKYYHGKETVEEMLFRKGSILTKIDITKAFTLLMIGLLFEVVSIAIISEGELEGFGIFIAILSSITFLIGVIALTLYPIGLNMLERAELLYNTRVTHEKLQQMLSEKTDKPSKPTTDNKAIPKNITDNKVEVKIVENVDIDNEGIMFTVHVKDNGDWICPECCRENAKDKTECKCGYIFSR